ncbi:MAG: hypothetical protein LIP03_14080 [Bacteroidales bacterium]|nr:hypothetical protein [Bacteroidales bacterium]
MKRITPALHEYDVRIKKILKREECGKRIRFLLRVVLEGVLPSMKMAGCHKLVCVTEKEDSGKISAGNIISLKGKKLVIEGTKRFEILATEIAGFKIIYTDG